MQAVSPLPLPLPLPLALPLPPPPPLPLPPPRPCRHRRLTPSPANSPPSFALVVRDGTVTYAGIDEKGLDKSSAESVLGFLNKQKIADERAASAASDAG